MLAGQVTPRLRNETAGGGGALMEWHFARLCVLADCGRRQVANRLAQQCGGRTRQSAAAVEHVDTRFLFVDDDEGHASVVDRLHRPLRDITRIVRRGLRAEVRLTAGLLRERRSQA
jgi:hypothetical protein